MSHLRRPINNISSNNNMNSNNNNSGTGSAMTFDNNGVQHYVSLEDGTLVDLKNEGSSPSTTAARLSAMPPQLVEKLVSKPFKDSRRRRMGTENLEAVMHVAFVSFSTRWGVAICAQTQQSKNPTIWLTEWAPEPCDVYWINLAIPFVALTFRRLFMSVSLFFLVFFFMITIPAVQSLANLEGVGKVTPFLKLIIEV